MFAYKKKYDVIVCGAGISGVAAAVSAARMGCSVALIEKQTLIGGLATSGLIFFYLPLCDGKGNQVMSGIPEELLKKSMEYSPFDLPQQWGGNGLCRDVSRNSRYDVQFSPAGFTLSLDRILKEANVDLWLETMVCNVRMTGNRIRAVEVENTSGRGLLTAKCFVDTTGEALLIRRAGGKVYTEENMLSYWMIENISNHQAKFSFADTLHVQALTWKDYAVPSGSALSSAMVTRYTRECWERTRKYLDESYKTSGQTRFEHFPVHLPAMAQFRKIAVPENKIMLTDNDFEKHFDSSIGMTGDWRKSGPIWETPFESLIPQEIQGVFTAGRCAGTLGDAWEIYRVIPAAAMTGEAAGCAAALCARSGVSSHELPANEVQKILRARGIKLHREEVLPDKDSQNNQQRKEK